MKLTKIVLHAALAFLMCGCTFKKEGTKPDHKETTTVNVDEILIKATKQLDLQSKVAEQANRIPRTVTPEGEMHWTGQQFDWTEGFFPGSLWYLFKASQDDIWKTRAEKFQALYEDHKYKTTNHDLGFVFNTSYGNGYLLTENEAFKEVMIVAADSLSSRFNPNVGCIKSWDVDRGWQASRGWLFPVIIDNMMNLELLFKVSEYTGDPKYKEIAITHAKTTLKNHFRDDNSSYHVVDYDPETGAVRSKQTAQGISHESSWARGQAWGLYGYTICYRYTKNPEYLNMAKKIAAYIIGQKAQKNGIPYWDYHAENIPDEPYDVSAAAITASALLELNQYTNDTYKNEVETILTALASDEFTAPIGTNHNFILKHSVGSIPHKAEIDVPLNYADYYYLEALLRYKEQYHEN
ncbi:glycoside hydrolase family 88 protein [Zobellia galactanivorans]|uniref:glycoside hydrolase family 88 protein n=1 Tax=Zobellia galactanivorans (strain DSM 12802 / CCUG 47099 / CIP 106680 / NCIMB 13871 / Dsij) TaxID=63186 RepID=UPI0026E48E45|nr:glycoside hydrolase family 88 protein [Zobellia galactanivorans]MDO6807558.1 glycoside hydrolase family 88 protein [Zobellia galactanivorans]